ncbi:metallophosphoesterase family protein [Balneola sp. MJW-20]|uniref:metallophosphoesterase family protein n=1 Tax=Gracilimonas aurantiaca TaxID=3234185 RepID=UPI00346744DB
MPKIALISDIHANYPALKAVLDKLEAYEPDFWLCLGDVVGYGPHPKKCIEVIRERGIQCVMGNHDAGVAGRISWKHFREPNRSLIKKTRDMLSGEEIQWLRDLPLTLENPKLSCKAVHASPVKPGRWTYLESAVKVRDILQDSEFDYILGGHTHKPVMVADRIGIVEIERGTKYYINPGSVGQPRDGDPRASCGLLDLKEMTYQNFRLEFDAEQVVADLKYLGFSDNDARSMMVMYEVS